MIQFHKGLKGPKRMPGIYPPAQGPGLRFKSLERRLFLRMICIGYVLPVGSSYNAILKRVS